MMAADVQGEQRKQTLKDKINVGEEEWNNTEPLGHRGDGEEAAEGQSRETTELTHCRAREEGGCGKGGREQRRCLRIYLA